jgi:hypothetical protein
LIAKKRKFSNESIVTKSLQKNINLVVLSEFTFQTYKAQNYDKVGYDFTQGIISCLL